MFSMQVLEQGDGRRKSEPGGGLGTCKGLGETAQPDRGADCEVCKAGRDAGAV